MTCQHGGVHPSACLECLEGPPQVVPARQTHKPILTEDPDAYLAKALCRHSLKRGKRVSKDLLALLSDGPFRSPNLVYALGEHGAQHWRAFDGLAYATRQHYIYAAIHYLEMRGNIVVDRRGSLGGAAIRLEGVRLR